MALFKPFRGSRSSLDAHEKHDGYAYFCVDDGSFHIDYVDANGELQRKQINAKEAETLSGTSLETILNSINSAIDRMITIRIIKENWEQVDEDLYTQNVSVYFKIPAFFARVR